MSDNLYSRPITKRAHGLAYRLDPSADVLALDRLDTDVTLDQGRMAATAIISTPAEDRDGDTVVQEGLIWTNYTRNPVVFFNHDTKGLPVGRSETDGGSLTVISTPERTTATCYFTQKCAFAEQIYHLVADKTLRGTSIGFLPRRAVPMTSEPTLGYGRINDQGQRMRGYRIEKAEVTEWSWVGVGANPEAVLQHLSKGLINGSRIGDPLRMALEPYAAKPRIIVPTGGEIVAPMPHEVEKILQSVVRDSVPPAVPVPDPIIPDAAPAPAPEAVELTPKTLEASITVHPDTVPVAPIAPVVKAAQPVTPEPVAPVTVPTAPRRLSPVERMRVQFAATSKALDAMRPAFRGAAKAISTVSADALIPPPERLKDEDLNHPARKSAMAEITATPAVVAPAVVVPEASYIPPGDVKAEAQRGLDWVMANGRGGSHGELERAALLVSGAAINGELAWAMQRFFWGKYAYRYEGWYESQPGFPSNERIEWALWGGDAAEAWIAEISKKIDVNNEKALAAGKASQVINKGSETAVSKVMDSGSSNDAVASAVPPGLAFAQAAKELFEAAYGMQENPTVKDYIGKIYGALKAMCAEGYPDTKMEWSDAIKDPAAKEDDVLPADDGKPTDDGKTALDETDGPSDGDSSSEVIDSDIDNSADDEDEEDNEETRKLIKSLAETVTKTAAGLDAVTKQFQTMTGRID